MTTTANAIDIDFEFPGEAEFSRRMVDQLTSEAKSLGEHIYLEMCLLAKKLEEEHGYKHDVSLSKALNEIKERGAYRGSYIYRLEGGVFRVFAIGLHGRVLADRVSPRLSKLIDRKKWAIAQAKEYADRYYLPYVGIAK